MGYVLGALMRLCILFALLSLMPPVGILLDYLSDYRAGYGVAVGREVLFLAGMPLLSGFFIAIFFLLRRAKQKFEGQ
jgi:hypothetical protein